jgi:membrane protein YdbS with pleckstrin-like domain
MIKQIICFFLKLPPELGDPEGTPRETKKFKAASGYFWYVFFIWILRQSAGFIFYLIFLGGLIGGHSSSGGNKAISLVLISAAVIFMLVGIFIEVAISFIAIWMDYEMRWYALGPRILRIREGSLNLREITVSYANIQNIFISQGPIQKLLGIADIKIKTAGGGGRRQRVGSENSRERGVIHMHEACLRGIENFEEIKKYLAEKIKKYQNPSFGALPDEIRFSSMPPAVRKEKVKIIEEIRKEFLSIAELTYFTEYFAERLPKNIPGILRFTYLDTEKPRYSPTKQDD